MGTVYEFSRASYSTPGAQPIAPGGGGPHDGGMETRVARLERVVEKIESDLATVRLSVNTIETQMPHLATKLWIVVGTLLGAIAVIGAMFGGYVWLVQKYLEPLLTKAVS